MEYFLIIIGMIGMFGLGYGLAGRRGPMGWQGAKGDLGSPGPQGPKGDRGPMGPGIRIVGKVNTKADLPVTGVVTGDAYAVLDINECWVWADEGWFPIGGIQELKEYPPRSNDA